MTDPNNALEYVRANQSRFLDELKELVAIPSVSTLSEHKADMKRAAEWVAAQLRGIGMKNVKIMPTGLHPVVYGEWLGAGKSAPTVMIYGHYDVQPVDPLDLWKTNPFEAQERGDYLFGRGASDMKGQVVASIKAVEAIMKSDGKLPVNVKWLVEGEEEIGSTNLEEFIKKNKKMLAADFCLNPDAGMTAADKPTITTGLRGLAHFELRVTGPARDLHSGGFGGTIHNPAQALAELLAGMHDKNGKITLPGFYEKVRKLSKKEREDFKRVAPSNKALLELTGAPALWGEPQFTPVERTGARPTLEINGMVSGFIGQGSKTIIPAWALAKISCRLVPDQSPEEVEKQLRAYLKQNAPKTIRWELTSGKGSGAALVSADSVGVRALAKAFEATWGKRPLFKREGGSIGAVIMLQKQAGVDSLLTGFGLPEDNIHSPNERLHLPTWRKGIEALTRFFYNF
ncbi:MAG: dipeptidase [Anaerolineales bacterium]|nr:dipeptidase [Anaerolineales bacterium]